MIQCDDARKREMKSLDLRHEKEVCIVTYARRDAVATAVAAVEANHLAAVAARADGTAEAAAKAAKDKAANKARE